MSDTTPTLGFADPGTLRPLSVRMTEEYRVRADIEREATTGAR